MAYPLNHRPGKVANEVSSAEADSGHPSALSRHCLAGLSYDALSVWCALITCCTVEALLCAKLLGQNLSPWPNSWQGGQP